MGLPFVLDIAIGLIFIFLILSLLASELQELITTLLQWRAKHLRESIEVLLAGGAETAEEGKVKELATRLYDDPLLRNVNQEAKGRIPKQFRALTQQIIGSSHKIFGKNLTTGPSYIPAETFATSLIERLGIPILARKLTEVRLSKFAGRIVGTLTYDRNGQVRLVKSSLLKNNWQKGSIRVIAESLNRPDLVDDETNGNFQLLSDLIVEYDDILRGFESGQSTLETSVERMGDSLKEYIENLKLKFKLPAPIAPAPPPPEAATPMSGFSTESYEGLGAESITHNGDAIASEPPDEAAIRFIRRLESFRAGIFGLKNERAILSGGLRPNVFEVAQLINQTSNTYREVADAYQQVTTKAKPISDKVEPEIQEQLLQTWLPTVENQIESDYFEILEKQLAEDSLNSLKTLLIQTKYLDQNVIEAKLKPEEYLDVLDQQLQNYVIENNLPNPDIGLADITDLNQRQAVIDQILANLSQPQRQRIVNAALSQIPAEQRQAEIIQPALNQLTPDQCQLLACQPIVNALLDKFEVPQQLDVIQMAAKSLAPEKQQRLLETIWDTLKVEQRQEIAEIVLDQLTERQRQRIVRSSWAVMPIEPTWDKLNLEDRQNLIEAAFVRLEPDQRLRLSNVAWNQLSETEQPTIAQWGENIRQMLTIACFGADAQATILTDEQRQKVLQRQHLVSSVFSELSERQRHNIALQLTIDDFRKLLSPEDQQLVNWEKFGARQLIINSVWGNQPATDLSASSATRQIPIDPTAPLPPEELLSLPENGEMLPIETEVPPVDEGFAVPLEPVLPELLPSQPVPESKYPLLSQEEQELIVSEFWEGLAADLLPSIAVQRLDKRIVSAAIGRLSRDLSQQVINAAWKDLTTELRQSIAENARPDSRGERGRIVNASSWQNLSQDDRQAIINAVAVEISGAQRQQVVEAGWQHLDREKRQRIFEAAWQSLTIPQRQRLLTPVLPTLKDEQRRLLLNLAWNRLNPLQQQLILNTYLQRLGEPQRQLIIDHTLARLPNADRRLLIDQALNQAQLTDEERRIYENSQTYKEIQQVLAELPQSLKESLESLARRSQSRVLQTGTELNVFRDEIGLWFDRSMSRATGVYKRNAKGVAIAIGIGIAILTNSDAIFMINRLSSDEELRRVISDRASTISPSPTVAPTLTANPTTAPTPAPSPEISPSPGSLPATSLREQLDAVRRETDEVLRDLALPIGWNLSNLRQQLRCNQQAQNEPNSPSHAPRDDWEIFFNECLGAEPAVNPVATPSNSSAAPAAQPRVRSHPERFLAALGKHWFAALLIPLGWLLSGLAIAMGAPFWFDLLGKIVNVRNTGSRPASASTQANPGTADTPPMIPPPPQ